MNDNFQSSQNCTYWENTYTYSYNQEVTSLDVFPDPDIFAVRYNNHIVVQKIFEEKPIHTLIGAVNFFGSFSTPIVVNSTGDFIATAMIEMADENVIKLYNLKTNTDKILGIHGYGKLTRVTAVVFSPDNRIVISAGGKIIKLWDKEYEIIERGELSGHFSNVRCLAVEPNQGLLASGDAQGCINLWKISSKTRILTIPPNLRPINSLAFSPDGQFLLSGSNRGIITICRVKSGKQYPFIQQEDKPINSIKFSPDACFLATGYDSGLLKVWNFKNPQSSPIWTINQDQKAVTTVVFTTDSKKLISGSKNGKVRVWQPVQ